MRTFRVNDDNDLDLTGGTAHVIDGIEARTTVLAHRFGAHRGEWFHGKSKGLPLFDEILVHGPELPFLELVFTNTATEGNLVKDARVTLSVDANRHLSVSLRAASPDGRIDLSDAKLRR